MNSRYLIILLVVSTTIPAFADNPQKTDCSGAWTVYLYIECEVNDVRSFFISSMAKQDVIIAQNSQIEKLLIQQNKLEAHTFCGENINLNMPSRYMESFDDCIQRVMDDTK